MRIFLDACIIIYWVEAAHPFYADLLAKLQHIAEEHPDHILTVSRLSLLECLVKPLRMHEKKIVNDYQTFFESPAVSIIELDHQVIDIATHLRATCNLRTPDAIQAACCLSINSPHLFLTNDKRFAKVPNLHMTQL
ncbi:MAG: PIN domain-containing protein [Gammaproteobacteria bacterium]|nr:PIN domain-containing protein [Gammaproteobacteria bacterium]